MIKKVATASAQHAIMFRKLGELDLLCSPNTTSAWLRRRVCTSLPASFSACTPIYTHCCPSHTHKGGALESLGTFVVWLGYKIHSIAERASPCSLACLWGPCAAAKWQGKRVIDWCVLTIMHQWSRQNSDSYMRPPPPPWNSVVLYHCAVSCDTWCISVRRRILVSGATLCSEFCRLSESVMMLDWGDRWTWAFLMNTQFWGGTRKMCGAAAWRPALSMWYSPRYLGVCLTAAEFVGREPSKRTSKQAHTSEATAKALVERNHSIKTFLSWRLLPWGKTRALVHQVPTYQIFRTYN